MRRSTILGVLVALLVLATSAYAQDEEATTFTPLVLDGQTSIEVEPSPALALGEASTIEFWIATAWEDEDGVESFPAVLGRREPYEGSEPEGFAAATQYSVHLTPDRQAIGLFDGTRFASVPFDFSDGRLHHVALVTEGDRTTIYVDREARGTVEVGLGEPSELPLHVGSSDGGSELFMGVLPSVRLWRSALTAEQVGAIAEVLGAPEDEGAPLDDLVAYSDFTGEAPEIVVLEDVAAPETSAVPELPTATPAVEVETRGLGDKIRKSKLKKKEKKLQEKVTKNEGELAQRQQAAARVRGRLRQYQNARPVRNKRIDMGGFSFTVGSVRVGDQVVGAGTAARRQRKLAKRLAKLDGEIADYTEKLDGPPSYGKNGARRGLRQKLGDTQNKLAALGGNAPAPKPPLRRTKAKQDLTADTNADDSASPPARPRRNWKKKPTPDNEVPDVGDIVQVGKNKKNLVAVAKKLKGGAFADVFVIEDPQGDKAILKQQKAWPKQAKEGMKDNYGEYKDRVETYQKLRGKRAGKLLTPDQLVEKASEHEVSMQNLASRRLKKLRDDGEDVPDVIDESELAGKGRIKQKFAGSSFGELFEDVDGIDDDDVKEACVRLMLTKMLQAAAALDRIDMVHRDLHDGNITMGENGQVKLIDFGLAKRKGDSDLKLEMTSGVGAKGEYGFKPPPETENAISSIYKKGATKADLAAASSFSSSSKADVYGVGFLMSGRTNQILKTPRKEMVDLMNELQADVPADRPSAADALTRLKAFDTGHEAAAETQLQGFAKARIQKTLAEPTTTVASE